VELVPGDLIVLAEGDVVPADAQLVQAAALLVDESALTGESVTVLGTDKTGTLTEGRMLAERLWTPAGAATAIGSGGAANDGMVRDGRLATADRDPDVAALLAAVVLCNDATLRPPDTAGGACRRLATPPRRRSWRPEPSSAWTGRSSSGRCRGSPSCPSTAPADE
jgi:magnesium-transporting ATPase (P-type)